MKSFSVVLSALRKETGYSQRQVAADLGVSQALLSHYENGAREPKLEFVVKACDYFGVSADYILGRADERKRQVPASLSDSEGGSRLMAALRAVFETLDELADPELNAAVIDYLRIPAGNADAFLHDPDIPYDPARDAEFKMAEAELLKLSRRITAVGDVPTETANSYDMAKHNNAMS